MLVLIGHLRLLGSLGSIGFWSFLLGKSNWSLVLDKIYRSISKKQYKLEV